MNVNEILVSTSISTAIYTMYKLYKKYYLKSECHNNTLEIAIVDTEKKGEKKEEEKKEEIHLEIV